MEEFLANLRKSNLLAPEQWKVAHALAARGRGGAAATGTAPLAPAELAGQLVQRGFITPWQAEMLLQGKKAFFLGNYRLLDCIGAGGMAAVFKALHGDLRRVVAVKLLRSGLVRNRSAVARFQHEMQAVAALDDPHIVTAYDAGRASGVHYLVMEYIEGRDFGYLVRAQGRLPVGVACELIRQAARGLQHAHEKGLVHRDIKPTNLLLTRDPDSGRPLVKILDLGLARFVSETSWHDAAESGILGSDASLTQIGQFLGTPDYIAPEQAEDMRSADIRSDLFSLGCTLFRLLTGELPFPGESVTEKLEARQKRPALRVRTLRSEVPVELDTVVARMLAREPRERYQTPNELAQALAPFASRNWGPSLLEAEGNEPVSARSSGDDTRLEEFFRSLATRAEDETLSVARVAKRLKRARWPAWLAGLALGLMLLVGLVLWPGPAATTLVIDWPLDQRAGAALTVDGRSIGLGAGPEIAVRGRAGNWRIRLHREGFEPIDRTVTLERGKRLDFVPEWRESADSLRAAGLAALETQLASAARPDASAAEVDTARAQLLAFLLKFPAGGEAAKAAALGMRLRWPLDQISLPIADPNDWRWMPRGDEAFEPVGVLGAGRLSFWGPVTAVATSSDGRYVAAASTDGTVQVFKPGDRSPAGLFEPAQSATEIAFSPAEPLLAVADSGGLVSLWNVETGKREVTLPAAFSPLAFSPDGRQIAVRATRQEIALHDVSGGQLRRTLQGHATGRLLGLAFSHNGKMLASYASDQSVMLWDVASGQERRRFLQSQRPMFSPDDSHLAAGATGGDLLLWDTRTGETQRALDEAGYPLAFLGDGRILVSKRLGRAILWNLVSGEELRTIVEVPERAAVSADGRWLAGAEESFGEVRLWDLAEASPPRSIATIGPVESLAFTSDSSQLAAGTKGHALEVWSLPSAGEVARPAYPIVQADLSPDGRLLAVRAGNRVELLDATSGERVRLLAEDVNEFDDLRFSPDGQIVAGFGGWGFFKTSLRLWDAASGRELSLDSDPSGTVRSMAFSADSQLLAAAGDSRLVTIWDASRRTVSRTIDDCSDRVVAVAFHPDGKRLAVACQDATVAIRVLGNGKVHKLSAAGGACRQLLFSPDGRWLAGAVDDRIVIWSASERTIAAELDTDGGATSLAFHPTGSPLIAGGNTGAILCWNDPARERNRDEPDAAIRIGPPHGLVQRVFWARDGRHLLSVNGNGTVYVLRSRTEASTTRARP